MAADTIPFGTVTGERYCAGCEETKDVTTYQWHACCDGQLYCWPCVGKHRCACYGAECRARTKITGQLGMGL